MIFFNKFTVLCDAPQPLALYFQSSASPQMETLIELHDNIMFYLVIILFGVAWIMVSIIRNYVYNKSPISNKYPNHGTLIELIWSIVPALIFLYLMDEVIDSSLTVFVEGHQWYWSYQYPDFIRDDDEELEFDLYKEDEITLHSDMPTTYRSDYTSEWGGKKAGHRDLILPKYIMLDVVNAVDGVYISDRYHKINNRVIKLVTYNLERCNDTVSITPGGGIKEVLGAKVYDEMSIKFTRNRLRASGAAIRVAESSIYECKVSSNS